MNTAPRSTGTLAGAAGLRVTPLGTSKSACATAGQAGVRFMAFEWLDRFQHRLEKEPDYAQKTLAAYRLGMKAKGSIVGVMVQPAPDCCDAARRLPAGKVYHPDQAPNLPLPDCPQGRRCQCLYRPVMSYQQPDR